MKTKLTMALVALALTTGATLPAQADDFAAQCKAHPPNEAAADTKGVVQFCDCVDHDTAGNDALRAEFSKTWSMPAIASRKAAMNAAANAVADKCRTHS